MQRDHARTCPANEGKPECRCGLLQLTTYGREDVALEILEIARSLRRSWIACPEGFRHQLFAAINPAKVMLYGDIEKLCSAVLRFDTAD